MKYLAVALMALIMSGCASLDARVSGVTESEQFARVCAAAPAVHLAFVAVASQTTLSERVLEMEANAYRVIDTTCRTKPSDHVGALQVVLTAYQRILDAQVQAARAAA